MQPFTKLNARSAPLDMINIDTDIIIPKQFLKTVARTGLGISAFYNLRYDNEGNENPEFSLNKPKHKGAEILIAGDNFGCGSSREHAPWAILDMGIKCIISTSFADIFFNNSFKNGLLPIIMPKDKVDALMNEAKQNPDALIEINLEKQTITRGNKFSYSFEIDPFRKKCLLEGLDDIGLTMQKNSNITAFEKKRSNDKPWI